MEKLSEKLIFCQQQCFSNHEGEFPFIPTNTNMSIMRRHVAGQRQMKERL